MSRIILTICLWVLFPISFTAFVVVSLRYLLFDDLIDFDDVVDGFKYFYLRGPK